LCPSTVITFDCDILLVNYRCLCFNVIITTPLFKLTIEFSYTTIDKDNKLRIREMWQSEVMQRILDGYCWHICDLIIFKLTCSVFLELPVVYVLICLRWSRYFYYQDSTLYYPSQWFSNLDLFLIFVTKKRKYALEIGNLIFLILLFSDPERSAGDSSSSSWIFR
jgi:hypothetical protein